MDKQKISFNTLRLLQSGALGFFVTTSLIFPFYAYKAWVFSAGTLSDLLSASIWILPALLSLFALFGLTYFVPADMPTKFLSKKKGIFLLMLFVLFISTLTFWHSSQIISGITTLNSIAMREVREYAQSQARIDAGIPPLEIFEDSEFLYFETSDTIKVYLGSSFNILFKKKDGKFVCQYEFIHLKHNESILIFYYVSEDFFNSDAFDEAYFKTPKPHSGYNIWLDDKRIPKETALKLLSELFGLRDSAGHMRFIIR